MALKNTSRDTFSISLRHCFTGFNSSYAMVLGFIQENQHRSYSRAFKKSLGVFCLYIPREFLQKFLLRCRHFHKSWLKTSFTESDRKFLQRILQKHPAVSHPENLHFSMIYREFLMKFLQGFFSRDLPAFQQDITPEQCFQRFVKTTRKRYSNDFSHSSIFSSRGSAWSFSGTLPKNRKEFRW